MIIDNGAGEVKGGYHTDPQPRYRATNATAKVNKTMQSLVAHQIDEFNNNGSLLKITRPFDRRERKHLTCSCCISLYFYRDLSNFRFHMHIRTDTQYTRATHCHHPSQYLCHIL